MEQACRFGSAVSLLACLLVAFLACSPTRYSTLRGPFTEVSLQAVGGTECVRVDPDPAYIWREAVPDRPHQVRWSVVGESSYRWVIEHQASKGGEDFFGRRVIPCTAERPVVASGLPRGLPSPGGEKPRWGYKVTLYACPAPSDEPVCARDPVIFIRDSDDAEH